jgi:uncharacterized membrane protein (DUF485 family)
MSPHTAKILLNDPRFRKIIRKKWLLGFGLSAVMIFIYAAFVLIMVLKPEWLSPSIWADNPFNVGLLSSVLLLMLIMGSMFCYFLCTRNDTHSDIHKLIAEHENREEDPVN